MDTLEKEPEMHDGVNMILARMKTHPEEFNGVGSRMHDHTIGGYSTNKWGAVIDQFWSVLTEYEQSAIIVGLREANRDCFLAAVMKAVLVENPKYKIEEKIQHPATQNNLISAYSNQAAYPPSSLLARPT